ncbi:MAG: fibrobacter succinogenes major paralogous domain-containing protein, partial [Methanococcaceae archaeon]
KNYGTQVWMLENLKTTKYNNGDLIGTTASPTLNYFGESAPKYQWAYNGDESYAAIYGRLYTWYAATDNRKICPTGWHLPTDEEWTIFTDFLTENGFGFEGSGNDIAKSIASSGWGLDPTPGVVGNDQVSNNSSGFTAVPAGSRTTDGFYSLNYNCFWWTATEVTELPVPDCAWFRFLHTYTSVLIKDYSGLNKSYGYSVRCLKD